MAHLWYAKKEGDWLAFGLDAEEVTFDPNGRPLRREPGDEAPPEIALVRGATDREAGPWVVCCAPTASLRVNGEPLRFGLHVLRDRDELVVGGRHRFFFGNERVARVESVPALSELMRCARCRQELGSETPAVRCPGCGTWYHQTEEYPCWTYAAHCQFCPQTTALDGAYVWTPDRLSNEGER